MVLSVGDIEGALRGSRYRWQIFLAYSSPDCASLVGRANGKAMLGQLLQAQFNSPFIMDGIAPASLSDFSTPCLEGPTLIGSSSSPGLWYKVKYKSCFLFSSASLVSSLHSRTVDCVQSYSNLFAMASKLLSLTLLVSVWLALVPAGPVWSRWLALQLESHFCLI